MRRGISPVIAVTLLLMMTVAIGGAAFFWIYTVQSNVQGSVGTQTSGMASQAGASIKVIGLTLDAVQDTLEITVQNTAELSVPAGEIAFTIFDDEQKPVFSEISNLSNPLRHQDFLTLTTSLGEALDQNKTYTLVLTFPGGVSVSRDARVGGSGFRDLDCTSASDCIDYCVGKTRFYGGSCPVDTCTWTSSEQCACDCSNGACVPDNCGAITCDDYCDGKFLNYNGTCTCNKCHYQKKYCWLGCSAGACVPCSTVCDDVCEHVTCYGMDPDCDSNGNPTVSCCGTDGCNEGENPFNCLSDCDYIDLMMIGGVHFKLSSYFNATVYTTYNGGWGPSTGFSYFHNYRLDTAYDSNNRPVVFYAWAESNTSNYLNYSYTFWTGSSWTPLESFMVSYENWLGSLRPGRVMSTSVDFYSDDDVLFVWENNTGSDNRAIYYALGDSSTMSPFKVAFTGLNFTNPELSIDYSDNAHLVFTDGHSIFYSAYNRVGDSWSSPIEVVNTSPNLIKYPELSFDHSGNGLLIYLNTTSSDNAFEYSNISYSYYNGASWGNPVPFDHINFTTGDVFDAQFYPKLGYDNNKWIIVFSKKTTHYYRTYNATLGMSGSTAIVGETTGFQVDFLPMYTNKEGCNVLVYYDPTGSVQSGFYFNSYAEFWNGTGFTTYDMIDYDIEYSCPFVYTYDGEDWHFEHEAYGFAVFKGWEYESHESLKHLRPVDGLLSLELREELNETSFTNRFSLRKVEHDPSLEVVPDLDGKIHTISEWVSPNYCNQDCLIKVKAGDSVAWVSDLSSKDSENLEDLREELILKFDKPEGAVSPKLFLRVKETGGIMNSWIAFKEVIGTNNFRFFFDTISSIPLLNNIFTDWRGKVVELVVSVWDGDEWIKADSFGVGGAKWNKVLIPLGEVSTENLRVKLESSVYTYYIDEVKVDYSPDEEIVIHDLELITAEKDGKSVINELLKDDYSYLSLNYGEKAGIEFTDIECPENKDCTYIISVKGYYEYSNPREVNKAFSLGVLNKVLYFLANPIETIKFFVKVYKGEDIGYLDGVTPVTTYFSLMDYFLLV